MTAKPENDGPQFLHHSVEASRLLCLPNSPILHLAVTTVVARLLALPHQSSQSAEAVRITAFRVASGTVLECLPFECAAATFLSTLIDAAEPDFEASDLAYRSKRTNWLSEARAAIVAEGADPGPYARPWATRYGWNSSRA